MFEIHQQGDLIPQQTDVYTSFPSMARDPKTGEVIVLYRKAAYYAADTRLGMQGHGLDGFLYTRRFNPATETFSEEALLASTRDYGPGILDGILTTVGETLFLILRRFPAVPAIYYAHGPSLQALGEFKEFPSRRTFQIRGGSEWGKITPFDNGKVLLQVIYGLPPEMRGDFEAKRLPKKIITRPALFQSWNQGETWHFYNWIGPLWVAPDITANETCILNVRETLYALMRTAGEMPGPLFLTYSSNGGQTWHPPRRTGLYGEAPVFYTLPNGRVLVGFRGFSPGAPEQGGSFSLCEFNPGSLMFSTPAVVEAYAGDHYDGGYGDMVWLPERNELLVCYYYSDTPERRNPWIRYALLRLNPS